MKSLRLVTVFLIILFIASAASGCDENAESGIRVIGPHNNQNNDTNNQNSNNNSSNNNSHNNSHNNNDDSTPIPVCGNGILEEGEVCDDGNIIPADGCNSSCTLKDGIEFVPYSHTEGDQSEPWLTGDSSGFALLWTDWNDGDGDGPGIRAAFFAGDGSPLGKLTVNESVTAGSQSAPRGAFSSGRYLFVWMNGHEDQTTGKGIMARMFHRDGTPAGEDFTVYDSTSLPAYDPSVAGSRDGTFLVVWTVPDASRLMGLMVDENGDPLPGASDDSTSLSYVLKDGLVFRPWLAPSSLGGWWCTYEYATDGVTDHIELMHIKPEGTPGVSISVDMSSARVAAPVVYEVSGNPVVCWLEDYYDSWGIRCRVFSNNLDPRTEPFWVVNSDGFTSFYNPRILDIGHNAMMLVWEDWSGEDGHGAGIMMQQYSLTGAAQDEAVTPETLYLGHQTQPTAIMSGDVAWFSWTDSSEESPDKSGKAVRLRSVLLTQ